ncbi:hypothetical protein KSF_055100 [Reticulibacter mediterranei]|uniref:Uncharacterized protein n=1 Tax=Reticulibacter mediterranei TaxID=2778369 RepID=A0A8J3N5T0_9CHLR|nr:hypothetical protein KSF_055100 [Reticulibacter mediterranei]
MPTVLRVGIALREEAFSIAEYSVRDVGCGAIDVRCRYLEHDARYYNRASLCLVSDSGSR